MRANTDRMLSMIDCAVAGSAPFLPVRLVVFPEFAHAAPVFPTVRELLDKLAVADPERAHRSPGAQGARARHLHPERIDDRSGSALAGRRVQHDLPDRARGDPLQVPQGESVDSVRGPRQSRTISRATTSRCFRSPIRRSAGSAARSATTGCFPRRSASSPPMAPRCWSASRPTWTRGARPSR